MTTPLRIVAVTVVGVLVWVSNAAAQDTLAAAQQLYGAASYEEALGALDRLKASATPHSPDVRTIEQYRAFCLFALGRQADAERAVEGVVLADPDFRPDEVQTSPRVLAVFQDVRRRLVPDAARQRYETAKAALDKKDYAAAVAGFDATLALIEAPDLAAEAQHAPLSDLRTLASGFRDLARAAAAPPPPPPAQTQPAASPANTAAGSAAAPTAPAAAPAPTTPRYYGGEDADVVAPVALNQRLPPWPGAILPFSSGVTSGGILEVSISETGDVESVKVVRPTVRLYDDRLLAEASHWKYKPATRDGQPVKYHKIIQVKISK